MFAGGGDGISLSLHKRSYFIKERFPRKTQAAYKILLNTQNRTCKVLFYLRKTRNVVLNYDMGKTSHGKKVLIFKIHVCLISCELFNTV